MQADDNDRDDRDIDEQDTIEYDVSDSIDLHGFRPSDISAVTRAYLVAARAKGFRYVRIVHGKGIGVQRETVRKILAETAFVKAVKSGDEFSGGWGATIAELAIGDQ
jgi:dsDNA-specific endonuclease/ATPase MutS2